MDSSCPANITATLHHAEQLPPRALHGMTNHLHRRVFQHRTQEFEGFSDDYDAVRLVCWESSGDVHKTIAREKQLKNWRREKKLWLIARTNPEFRDLAAG